MLTLRLKHLIKNTSKVKSILFVSKRSEFTAKKNCLRNEKRRVALNHSTRLLRLLPSYMKRVPRAPTKSFSIETTRAIPNQLPAFVVTILLPKGDRLQHESRAHFQPHATITKFVTRRQARSRNFKRHVTWQHATAISEAMMFQR